MSLEHVSMDDIDDFERADTQIRARRMIERMTDGPKKRALLERVPHLETRKSLRRIELETLQS